jgi:hypothetical protein
MPTGFIYVIPSVGADYQQASAQAVPTWYQDRLYFGPCKKPMRPRMRPGDFVFGISPSGKLPRRIVFAARISKRMTFADAYGRFPKLRGPNGPIHVRPARRPGANFPDSQYEHIPGANHANSWRTDIRTPELDVFFVFDRAKKCEGRWLGRDGPVVRAEILEFLRSCAVYGKAGLLSPTNQSATETAPVKHGRLYTGLHLETNDPTQLLRLVCDGRISGYDIERDEVTRSAQSGPTRSRRRPRRTC